jgi:hypothetical protein
MSGKLKQNSQKKTPIERHKLFFETQSKRNPHFQVTQKVHHHHLLSSPHLYIVQQVSVHKERTKQTCNVTSKGFRKLVLFGVAGLFVLFIPIGALFGQSNNNKTNSLKSTSNTYLYVDLFVCRT